MSVDINRQHDMLEDIFNTFDLSAKEARIYMYLLENGAKPVGHLAKHLNIPRTTLYGHLEKIQTAGFVTHSLEKSTKRFSAESPEKLNLLYKQKLDRMQAMQRHFEKSIPELTALAGHKDVKPRLQYFENTNALHGMMNDILLYNNIEVYSFWPVQSMITLLGEDYLTYFNIARIKKNITLKAVWPPTQAVDVKRYPFMASGAEFLREMRVTPDNIDSRLSYMVYQDKVMFMSSHRERYGFILQSKDMAEMLISQFMMIWNISAPAHHPATDARRFLDLLDENEDEWGTET